eukprot:CAMPEP_0115841848 /NCGR_PEP_ID=MMETSP0287-20121206/7500_1 /TAXON_ID=412157 /ORGANISM="Chrysochromulina rotalis, Strain UIO044" /LENGTH=324 /DNA_ID=CAMNT_0003295507 /DNA_START=1 /DNA_END=975 /DNA_ORIENTATION=-
MQSDHFGGGVELLGEGKKGADHVEPDSRHVWIGPLPTDPLKLVLEYKLSFDDISDLKAKTCIVSYLEGRELTAEDTKVLAEAMIEQGPCDVEYLFFAKNKIGDEGIEAIAEAITAGALPKLLTVDFTSIGASDEGFIKFINSIKHCEQFRDIIFKQNGLSDRALAELHAVLKRGEWPFVERVNLSGEIFERHTISDTSFVPFANDLADGVIKMIRLEELELSDTNIGDAGYAAFAKAIARGNVRKLRSLYMQACCITDEGAAALATALTNNKRTKLFDIRLGYQNSHDVMAPRVTKEVGKVAIEEAGASIGRKVHCVLHPLDPN